MHKRGKKSRKIRRLFEMASYFVESTRKNISIYEENEVSFQRNFWHS